MTMTTLMKASHQWATRPDDQRFTSLDEMLAFSRAQRERSRSLAVSSRRIEARPVDDDPKALAVLGPDGQPTLPSNWAFGQLANRIKAPAGYLRTLPSDIAADAINYGLQSRGIEDVGALLRMGEVDAGSQIMQSDTPQLAALTGPNYGRVWNSDVIDAMRQRFGNGVDGDFTVPGEFGKAVQITKDNTTLFASDRDMFIFLADEQNRIEVPNRRNGQPGSLARGFFVWNSEVGSTTLGISTFLFDYVCCNRIVWGAQDVQEIRIRHTVSAPDKFIEEVGPAMIAYSKSSAQGINDAIAAAQARKISGDEDEVLDFIAKRTRFSRTQAEAINLAHKAEEGRPIETLWDATVGITAYAKAKPHQDARIDIEREGGKVMSMAR
jgi:hypothetical protein